MALVVSAITNGERGSWVGRTTTIDSPQNGSERESRVLAGDAQIVGKQRTRGGRWRKIETNRQGGERKGWRSDGIGDEFESGCPLG